MDCANVFAPDSHGKTSMAPTIWFTFFFFHLHASLFFQVPPHSPLRFAPSLLSFDAQMRFFASSSFRSLLPTPTQVKHAHFPRENTCVVACAPPPRPPTARPSCTATWREGLIHPISPAATAADRSGCKKVSPRPPPQIVYWMRSGYSHSRPPLTQHQPGPPLSFSAANPTMRPAANPIMNPAANPTMCPAANSIMKPTLS